MDQRAGGPTDVHYIHIERVRPPVRKIAPPIARGVACSSTGSRGPTRWLRHAVSGTTEELCQSDRDMTRVYDTRRTYRG
jgi:hypothetical protein